MRRNKRVKKYINGRKYWIDDSNIILLSAPADFLPMKLTKSFQKIIDSKGMVAKFRCLNMD